MSEARFRDWMESLARVLIGLLFVHAALFKIPRFAAVASEIASRDVPAAGFLLVMAIGLMLSGGAMLMLGWRVRLAATLLMVFLLPTTLIYHNVLLDPAQSGPALKNMAIMGALLHVAAQGRGPIGIGFRS